MRNTPTVWAALLLAASSLDAQQALITTMAGADRVPPVNPVPALAVSFGELRGVAADNSGNLYISDPLFHVVLRMNANGMLRILAGNTIPGYSGDGGEASSASLNAPSGLAAGPDGSLYIADTDNHRIRRVAPDGTITTVAGTGAAGYSGDNGAAASAALRSPTALAFDPAGNLFIADTGNHCVRRVTPTGTITTVAGTGAAGFSGDGGAAARAELRAPEGVAADGQGNVYIADTGNQRVRRVGPNGIIITYAGTGEFGGQGDGGPANLANLASPKGLLISRTGDLLIADQFSYRVRRVASSGGIGTVAGNGTQGFGGDGGPATAGSLSQPVALALDGAGNLYVADFGIKRVRRVGTNGVLSSVAGTLLDRAARDGGPATGAELDYPNGMVFDGAGNLFFVEANRVRRVARDGVITTVAGNGRQGYSGDGGPAREASLSFPFAVALGPGGNLFIADTYNHRIRRVTPEGVITTVAGNGIPGFSGDGGPATQAQIAFPTGVAFDAQGALYIADLLNNRVRRVTPQGTIGTFAGCGVGCPLGDGGVATQAMLQAPYLLAFDRAGNLYIADSQQHRVRRVTPQGLINTVAGNGRAAFSGDGGPATSASLNEPRGIAIDDTGAIFITDNRNHRVRVVRNGVITTVAGTGVRGFSGDGGPATSATLYWPTGIALDAAGRLFFSDSGNHRVRAVLATAGGFTVEPPLISLSGSSDGAAPPDATIQITGQVAGLSFTARSSASWLRLSREQGTIPSAVQVSVNPAGLAPGSYTATVTVEAAGANPPSRSAEVRLEVGAAKEPVMTISSGRLNFSFTAGAAASSAPLTVANTGGGALDYSAAIAYASAAGWLKVSPAEAVATPTQPVNMTVTADPAGLDPGTYQATLTLQSAATGQKTDIPVTLTLTAVTQRMLVSQTGLTFTAVARGGAPLPQAIGILNLGRGAMPWTLRASTLDGGDWLKVSESEGSSTGGSDAVPMVDVGIDPRGLAPGEYSGQIRITSRGAVNSPQYVSVVLNVLAAGSATGPELRPTGLIFTGVEGSRPGSQSVRVANRAERPLTFNSGRVTEDGRQWFLHAPVSASLDVDQQGRIVVQPEFSSLRGGVHRGVLTVLFSDGSVRTVNILTVVAPPGSSETVDKEGRSVVAGCNSTELRTQLTSLRDGAALTALQPATIEAKVVDNCGNPFTSGQVFAAFSNGDRDLDLTHIGNGTWTGTWQPRNPAADGVQVTVSAIRALPLAVGQARLSCSVRTGSRLPLVSADSVQNAASLAEKSPVAPGSLVTLKGQSLAEGEGRTETTPYSTELLTTQVLLGGEPLPLLYAADGQINAQIPYNLNVNTSLQLLVRRGTSLSVPEEVTVAPAIPAIFTRDQSGRGQGTIQRIRGEEVAWAEPGTPARAGDLIVLYCAGLGRVTPDVPAGTAAPDSPLAATVNRVSVAIGGVPAEVRFSGLAPGLAGLYVVQAVVPAGAPAGGEIPVRMAVAGQVSPVVTMAVE